MNGLQLAQQGMQLTLEREREEWILAALEGLRTFASLPGWSEFKLEDFRAWWLAEGNPEPHDHHVFGALTSKASKAGIIEWTGRFATSVSPKTHGHPVRVWRLAFCLSSQPMPMRSDYRIHGDGSHGVCTPDRSVV